MRCWKSDHDARNKDFFEDKDYGGFPALSIRFYPSTRESLGFEALVFYSSNENSHFNLPVVEHTYIPCPITSAAATDLSASAGFNGSGRVLGSRFDTCEKREFNGVHQGHGKIVGRFGNGSSLSEGTRHATHGTYRVQNQR